MLVSGQNRMVNNADIGGTENHGMIHEMAEKNWEIFMAVKCPECISGMQVRF